MVLVSLAQLVGIMNKIYKVQSLNLSHYQYKKKFIHGRDIQTTLFLFKLMIERTHLRDSTSNLLLFSNL